MEPLIALGLTAEGMQHKYTFLGELALRQEYLGNSGMYKAEYRQKMLLRLIRYYKE